jgi:hypothetical protein
MREIVSEVQKIAQKIGEMESKREKLAVFLGESGLQLKKAVRPDPLEAVKIAGVDGGIAKQSLHGLDCMLVRAACACFEYRKGSVVNVNYFPSRFPVPEPVMLEALSDLDWAYSASVARQKREISTAIQAAGQLSPDVLLLDGLIVPHHSDKPSASSAVYGEYQEMAKDYEKLFALAEGKKLVLAGVTEDSRNPVFCEMINKMLLEKGIALGGELEGVLEKTRDTSLLFLLLEKGERTMAFRYSENPKDHPVLKDFGAAAVKIHSFYLKTAKWDRPIKVDFLCPDGDPEAFADGLAAILISISGQHSGYGIPAPIIEADNIAKLSEAEMESFYSQILRYTGNRAGLMKLRRNLRPF